MTESLKKRNFGNANTEPMREAAMEVLGQFGCRSDMVGFHSSKLGDYIGHLEALLDVAALRLSEGKNEWVPVGTPPPIGEVVLVSGFNFGEPHRGRWFCVAQRTSERTDVCWQSVGRNMGLIPPTHWKTLEGPQ